jgi:hypothetical protein
MPTSAMRLRIQTSFLNEPSPVDPERPRSQKTIGVLRPLASKPIAFPCRCFTRPAKVCTHGPDLAETVTGA